MTTVHIIKKSFGGSSLGPTYTVEVDGQYYEVRSYGLKKLQEGVIPEELGIEPFDFYENEPVGESPTSLENWYWGRVL